MKFLADLKLGRFDRWVGFGNRFDRNVRLLRDGAECITFLHDVLRPGPRRCRKRSGVNQGWWIGRSDYRCLRHRRIGRLECWRGDCVRRFSLSGAVIAAAPLHQQGEQTNAVNGEDEENCDLHASAAFVFLLHKSSLWH